MKTLVKNVNKLPSNFFSKAYFIKNLSGRPPPTPPVRLGVHPPDPRRPLDLTLVKTFLMFTLVVWIQYHLKFNVDNLLLQHEWNSQQNYANEAYVVDELGSTANRCVYTVPVATHNVYCQCVSIMTPRSLLAKFNLFLNSYSHLSYLTFDCIL